jgi:hypothetical protein
MKKVLLGLVAATSLGAAVAAPVTVTFGFDTIATGSFTFDSSKDGSVIGLADLSAFSLQFNGGANSLYDLAFLQSGGFSVYYFMGFDSAVDAFTTLNISGFPTTLAAIKPNFDNGFFIRDDLKVIRDYAVGGSEQSYRALTLSVDRGNDVPEPASYGLVALGLVAAAAARRRKAA